MNTLIIKPQHKSDYELFVSLAKRLKVKYEEQQPLEDDVPTEVDILNQIQKDYIALKKGTLKTRPFSNFIADLKEEGLL